MSGIDVVVAGLGRTQWMYAARAFQDAGYRTLVLEPALGEHPGGRHRVAWPSTALLRIRGILPASLREWATWAAYRQMGRFVERRCRLGRCYWGGSGLSLGALKECRRAGIPTVLDCGSTHIAWQSRRLEQEAAIDGRAWAYSRPQRSTNARVLAEYEHAERIAVPGRFAAGTFVERGVPETRLRLNPYGADLDFWRPALDRPASRDGPTRVVFTGSLMLRKGVRYLLQAWRELDPADAELWLVGTARPDAADLVGAPLPGVRLQGWRRPAELVEIYRQSHLFVLPSLEEGMARAVLEAMAAGLPVLVTRETGTTDVVVDGQDGWVVPSADAGALAERLGHALRHREQLARMGTSALRRIAAYGWDAYGERAVALLRELIGPARQTLARRCESASK